MSYGIFESALADDHEERHKLARVQDKLSQAVEETRQVLGSYLKASKSNSELVDRLKLTEEERRQIASKYLQGESGFKAVSSAVEESYKKKSEKMRTSRHRGGSLVSEEEAARLFYEKLGPDFEVRDLDDPGISLEMQEGVNEVADSVARQIGVTRGDVLDAASMNRPKTSHHRKRVAYGWSKMPLGQGGFLGDADIFEGTNGAGTYFQNESEGGYDANFGKPGNEMFDDDYEYFESEDEARAWIEQKAGGGRNASRRARRKKGSSVKVSDHWKTDAEFQHFLIDVFGTTDVDNATLVEALELYGGVGGGESQSPLEQDATEDVEKSTDPEVVAGPFPPEELEVRHLSSKSSENVLHDYVNFCQSSRQSSMSMSSLQRYARRSDRTTEELSRVASWIDAQNLATATAESIYDKLASKVRTASVTGWDYDRHLDAYVSKKNLKFSCSCGAQLDVPGYHNCKCGKIWNGYKISSNSKEASAPIFVVRSVEKRDFVLARRS